MGESDQRGDLKPIGDVLIGLCFEVKDAAQMHDRIRSIYGQLERDGDLFEAYRLTSFLCMSAIERCAQLEREVADVGAALARCRARRDGRAAGNGSAH